MSKSVFSQKHAGRADSPYYMAIWPFTVPSNPGLAVPFSPAVPAHTFSLISAKLKEIEKFYVQQSAGKVKVN